MDSPESSVPATASETAPVQDSPVFSYLSNLSPIQPVKAPSVTQDFHGLNSPPLVFTSPRLNLHNQPTFHKREQFPLISFAKLQEQLENSKNGATTFKGHEKLEMQSSTEIVASCEKAFVSNGSVDELIQSPSGSREQLQEDIVNADSPDLTFTFDSSIKVSKRKDQPSNAPTSSQDILVNLQRQLSSGKNDELSIATPSISQQTEEAQEENIMIHVSASENDIKQGDGVSVHCQEIGPELPADNSFVNQEKNNFMAKNAEAELDAPLDLPSHLLTGSKVNVKENENVLATTGTTSTGPSLKNVQNNLKAFQNRGARRRCLQFEDAQRNAISNILSHQLSDGEGAKSLSLETPSMLIDEKMYPRNTLNSSTKLPKPSGIGLHLNSIVSNVQAGSGAMLKLKAAQWATTDGNKHESQACVSAVSTMTLSTDIVKPANNLVTLNSKGNLSTLSYKRKTTEKGSGLEEADNLSPKKRRMNTTDSGDGCKRCNCKRSKCLKLYCDCFAAGVYCAEPCACQECYNRPEYEDIVIETRQKIESRDPFAFAPRVVQHAIEQPTISCGEDRSNFTPASARHKKGCKCKKSMCLKKYCECYQANVGCSDGCRCEGCKNVYGRKGEYGMAKIVLIGEDAQETTDSSFVEESDISGNPTYHPDFVNPHNLTPLTPAFQFSNHGKDESKAWFPSGKYFLSPESGLTYAAPYMMPLESPINPEDNVAIPERSKDIFYLTSLDQESLYANDEFSASCPQSGKMGQFSDIANLQKWDNSIAQPRNYLPGSSFVWRGSPITPMAQFSGSNAAKEFDFNFGSSNLMQDDTPEILRDTPNPLNTVKSTSPNKKRVSPPHGRLHEFGSSSSASIRSGRKFVLQGVPPFPPLTPCTDSKTSGAEHDSFPESHDANK